MHVIVFLIMSLPGDLLELPKFIKVPFVAKRIEENSIYADIINHSKNPHLAADRDTNAHETTHIMDSRLRIEAESEDAEKGKLKAFYIPRGKAVIIQEPKKKKRDIIPFLPLNLRSKRFEIYITGQPYWENEPLKIFEEWNAYINGGMVSVEDVKNGRYTRVSRGITKGFDTDAVSACLEFSIYAVALAMAVEENDLNYWETNRQFKKFLIWNLKRSQKLFEEGCKMPEFNWNGQEKLLKRLLTSKKAARMREFLKDNLGGVWLDCQLN